MAVVHLTFHMCRLTADLLVAKELSFVLRMQLN